MSLRGRVALCRPLFLQRVRPSIRVAAALSVAAAGTLELAGCCCLRLVQSSLWCGVQAGPRRRGLLHTEVIAQADTADKTLSPISTSPTSPCAMVQREQCFNLGGGGRLNPEDGVDARRRIWILSPDRAKSLPRSAFLQGAARSPFQVNSISLHVLRHVSILRSCFKPQSGPLRRRRRPCSFLSSTSKQRGELLIS